MKRTTFFLACSLLTGLTVNAQVLDTIYNAKTALPAAASWTELKLDKTISDSAAVITQELLGGALKLKALNSNNKDSKLGWYKTGLGLNLSTGYTIEIKAKVNNAAKNGAFNLQGYDNQGKGFRFGIYNSYLTNQTNPLGATTTVASSIDNSTGFHTFRLAVAPSGLVTVYRDKVLMGTFPISAFYFDNIIVNGGFEDGANLTDGSAFPDFLSKGLLYRSTVATDKRTGNYGLIMNSNGKTENTGTNYNAATQEKARTREIAVKPNTKYDISITRRRSAIEPWAWRDMGAFYNTQVGTQGGTDVRGTNAIFTGVNDNFWQIHNQTITTPADVKSIRFEFPSWIRDGNKTTAISSFDDFVFREQPTLAVGVTTAPAVFTPNALPLPANYTNLIKNGDFENWNIDNAGNPVTIKSKDGLRDSTVTWALSDLASGSDNNPNRLDPLWNGLVRIQRNDQTNDGLTTGDGGATVWAHSGTSALRFSTLGNNANSFDFKVQLKTNTKYRFNFWHKSPKWDDAGWLKVKIGEGDDATAIWGHELRAKNNVWTNSDLVFTTGADAANTTLHLYTNAASHGNWWNLYLDDLVLYEVTEATDPDITAGKTNLIANSDFEDVAHSNDGTAYDWALASTNTNADANYPVKWNDTWGSFVKLQNQQKLTDTGLQFAHSGTKSMRFSFLDDQGGAKTFEGITKDSLPSTYRINLNFQKELQPNKTYTFVFWVKAANYPDRGRLIVANGDIQLWNDELSTRNINWTRQVVTFSTTAATHTLRLYTTFGGWFNFYLDDVALYEEATYVPYQANGDSYLFFGKSQGTEDTDVEIQYVAVNNTGAFAPANPATGTFVAPAVGNLKVTSNAGMLTINASKPTFVVVYDVAGVRVAEFNVQSTKSLSLPQGIYVVKSASEVMKVVNK
ncbi:MAG: hypothetical protein PHR83_00250 [Paludibacter sp.]|nr:hypothetical protein [Paludibacter sp.]